MQTQECIVRRWQGCVASEHAQDYARLMDQVAISDYLGSAGNLGAFCLRRDNGDISIFVMLSFWRDIAAVKAYAGEDYEKAQYYDFDDMFLLEKEEFVVHFLARGRVTHGLMSLAAEEMRV